MLGRHVGGELERESEIKSALDVWVQPMAGPLDDTSHLSCWARKDVGKISDNPQEENKVPTIVLLQKLSESQSGKQSG